MIETRFFVSSSRGFLNKLLEKVGPLTFLDCVEWNINKGVEISKVLSNARRTLGRASDCGEVAKSSDEHLRNQQGAVMHEWSKEEAGLRAEGGVGKTKERELATSNCDMTFEHLFKAAIVDGL